MTALANSWTTGDQFTPVITGMYVYLPLLRFTYGLRNAPEFVMLTGWLGSVLVNLSLIIATVPRLHSFLAKIPTGQASTRLPSFMLPNHLTITNRTEIRAASNSQNNENGGSTNMPKLVPDYSVVLTTHISGGHDQRSRGRTIDRMVAGSGGIEEDTAALSRTESTKQSRLNTTSSEKSKEEAQGKD